MDVSSIREALHSRMCKGCGLSVPYARKWEIGGCEPTHSLRSYPYDGLHILATGLSELGRYITPVADGLLVAGLWVSTNRSTRGDGPPDAYLIGQDPSGRARYAGNSPEVVLEMLRLISSPPQPHIGPQLQVGFHGIHDSATTYVGSWQWNIHGEARDDEFIHRAAAATLAAITAVTGGQEAL
ncbi:hypothetical protein [Mycolicibacterium sp. HK-90]|uniref:hypothetical protein n=1 Tax=Mycolicibacterium sp. HK-90 TaxID=3056937 RepID=UPI00265B17A1|nr:hypothetical protein [Mycolicibacterium sp. HK-90]WKG04081.1 hypothetical protein QU592_02860 [Mycolicibacterium sp. HK-90]